LAGLVILNSNFSEPLLPMFSGLFGIPLIIESIKNKTKIKEQENRIHLPKKKLKPLIFAGLSSMICGFLPGLGTSQSAVLSTSFYKTSREEFLMLIGAAIPLF
jgi:TctA family transporter